MPEHFYYANEDGTEYRAPRWWLGYLAGSLLMVIGFIAPCGGLMVMGFATQSPVGTTMKPPGKMTVQIVEPGEQVIWVDEPDGDTLGKTPAIPTDFVAVVTSPNGSDVPARRPMEELPSTTMHSSRNGAALFAADFKGAYVVEVKGTFKSDQIIAVTADQTPKDTGLALGALLMLLLAVLLVGGGIVTLIITGVRHSKARGSAI